MYLMQMLLVYIPLKPAKEIVRDSSQKPKVMPDHFPRESILYVEASYTTCGYPFR